MKWFMILAMTSGQEPLCDVPGVEAPCSYESRRDCEEATKSLVWDNREALAREAREWKSTRGVWIVVCESESEVLSGDR